MSYQSYRDKVQIKEKEKKEPLMRMSVNDGIKQHDVAVVTFQTVSVTIKTEAWTDGDEPSPLLQNDFQLMHYFLHIRFKAKKRDCLVYFYENLLYHMKC